MILAFLGFVAVFAIGYYMWTQRDLYKLSYELKGPIALPIIGCFWMFAGRTHEDYIKILDYVLEKYGSMSRFWLGYRLHILISDPRRIQSILYSQECLNRDDVYDFVGLLGDGGGLLNMKGQMWKDHRKFLNPCFSLRILQNYMPIFNEHSATMMKNMQAQIGKKDAFNFYEYMDACTLDMICQTTLGTPMNIQKGENQDYLHACNNLFELITIRIFQPWFHSDFLYKFSSLYGTVEKLRKTTSNFVQVVLDKKIADYDQRQLELQMLKTEPNNEEYKKPQIYIDQVLDMYKEGKLETKTDVKAHVGTNVATGFETSALISSYCVLMMAMHHEVQDKVYEEIVNIYGKDNKTPNVVYEDLTKMDYLDRVLKETLRLFPVVPYFVRKVHKDFFLDGHKFPPNVRLVISMITVHHDKTIWGPDAEKFDPDNFLPEKVQSRHPYSYIPFGGGLRNCIGMRYSLLSMKTMIIHLLSNYRVNTNLKMEELRTRIDVTLKLINKHMVSVERR